MEFQVGAFVCMMAVLYVLAEILKKTLFKQDKDRTLIPLICALLGGVAGAVGSICIPNLVGTSNVFFAVFLGIVGGLSATGGNQVYKQIKKRIKEFTDEFGNFT